MDNKRSTDLTFSSRRSPVYGRRGMVAASQPLAVAAGLEVLAAGGTAADAAIATAAGLNVTEPTSTGIGGDCFALYYEAATGQITALNGSGRAPAALTLERLRREGLDEALPPFHPYTVTVPGACAGWCDLVARHGRLPLSRVLEPAIRLAEEGFPVAPITAYHWDREAEHKLRHSVGGQELTLNGRAPKPGEIFRNPGLARTLSAVASGGKEAYYQGSISRAVVAVVQQAGGCLEEADLAAHTSTWETPISVRYRDLRIWECPPNGQGLAALLALRILEGYDLTGQEPLSPARIHLAVEAMRLAFVDAFWHVADPAFSPAPLAELLSDGYVAQRRRLIDLGHVCQTATPGALPGGTDTVYFAVVDGEGNACSFINSNYMGFGTGIVPRGWGFSLQNRGHNFSLRAEHPNALAPGKRPYHTIIPALATRESDGSLDTAFGVVGDFMQPQGHLQVAMALVDDQLDPQSALDRLRWRIEFGGPGSLLAVEEGMPPATVARLADLGHTIRMVNGQERSILGRGQIIRRDPATGMLCAGSDPRADGCAMTF